MPKEFTIYRLQGTSLQAIEELQAAAKDKRPLDEATRKAHLSALGFYHEAVRVMTHQAGFARAYAHYPETYTTGAYPGQYFCVCPTDHKGEHFIPEGAVPLSEQESKEISPQINPSGMAGNIPLLSRSPKGTDVPTDFDPVTSSSYEIRDHANLNGNYNCFRAEGRTRSTLDHIRERMRSFEAKQDKLFKILDEIAGDMIHAAAPDADQNGPFTIERSFTEDAYRMQLLALHVLQDGEPVKLEENPYFIILQIKQDGGYIIEPRDDTPEGRKLRPYYDNLPVMPSFDDYENLRDYTNKSGGQDYALPELVTVQNAPYLLYPKAPNAKAVFKPQGAIQVPVAELIWRKLDENDRALGIHPPPMPDFNAAGSPPPSSPGPAP